MKQVALPKVTRIIMEPPSSTYNASGEGLPFFQGKADFGDLYPTVRMYCTEPKKVAEAGDILISVRAPVGPTNIAPEKLALGEDWQQSEAGKGFTEQETLSYFLRFYGAEISRRRKGLTFSAISRSDLESVEIPLPPLPEQQRIAASSPKPIGSAACAATPAPSSDTYLQSVFLRMFGDPVDNPMGWEQATRSDVRPFRSMALPTSPTLNKRGIPSWEWGNITYSRKNDLASLSYVELPKKNLKRCELEPGDIIFNRTNSTELVGKTARSELLSWMPSLLHTLSN